jgi:hypothetical protein
VFSLATVAFAQQSSASASFVIADTNTQGNWEGVYGADGTTLKITTTLLASGQVGTAYSQTLTATGGTTPYTWTLTSGTLPSGLTLNSSTGLISGTPTAAANATALTFKVTDSSSKARRTYISLKMTIAPAMLTMPRTG